MKWNKISEKQPKITQTTRSEICLCKNIITDAERDNFPEYEMCRWSLGEKWVAVDFDYIYSPEVFDWIYIKDIEEEINQLGQDDLKGLAAREAQ